VLESGAREIPSDDRRRAVVGLVGLGSYARYYLSLAPLDLA